MEPDVEDFLSTLKARQGISLNTLLAYRADLQQFGRIVNADSPSAQADARPTPEAVRTYVEWLLGQSYKASTVARKMAAVRGYLRSRPYSSLPELLAPLKPPPTEPSGTQILTRSEIDRLLSAPVERGRARDLRDAAILAILYFTGLRASDAVGLQLGDVDLSAGVVVSGRIDSSRSLAGALGPVRQYIEKTRPGVETGSEPRALFLNQRGGALSRQGLWLVVKRWARSVGLGSRISPHTLRLSRAAHLLDQGVPAREIQSFLGLSRAHGLKLPQRGESPEGGTVT